MKRITLLLPTLSLSLPSLSLLTVCVLLCFTSPGTTLAEVEAGAEGELGQTKASGAELPRLVLAYDYYYLWAAGHGALHNRNVYDKGVYGEELILAGRPMEWSYTGWVYPPWAFTFLMPYASFPFPLAKIMWISTSALVLGFCVYASRTSTLGKELLGNPCSLPSLISFVILFPPVLRFFHLGQTSFILLGSSMVFFLLYRREKFFLSGLALSVSLTKFHLLLPFYAAIVGLSYRDKRLSPVIGLGAGLFLQCSVVHLFYPNALIDYIDAWRNHGSEVIDMSTSASKIIAETIGIPTLQFIPLITFSFIALFWGASRTFSLETLILLVHPLAIALTPYVWVHTSLQLLLPYLFICSNFHARNQAALWAVLLFQYAAFLYVYHYSAAEYYAPYIPLVIAAGAYYVRRNQVGIKGL